jgi:hypothetical protein
MLQAMKEEPPLAAKCKDKFLIQSTFITPAKETMNLKEIVRGFFSSRGANLKRENSGTRPTILTKRAECTNRRSKLLIWRLRARSMKRRSLV